MHTNTAAQSIEHLDFEEEHQCTQQQRDGKWRCPEVAVWYVNVTCPEGHTRVVTVCTPHLARTAANDSLCLQCESRTNLLEVLSASRIKQ